MGEHDGEDAGRRGESDARADARRGAGRLTDRGTAALIVARAAVSGFLLSDRDGHIIFRAS